MTDIDRQLLSIREVEQLTGIDEKSIRRWSKRGLFPAPLRCGRRMIRWQLSKITEWVALRQREADRAQQRAR
jgi:prophage regulatory protein